MALSLRTASCWLLASPLIFCDLHGQTVVAWGDNLYGKCDVPQNATNVVAVAAGNLRSVALRKDGSVVCWGYGASVHQSATNVIKISAGERVMALRKDGKVVLWGYTGLIAVSNVVDIASGGGRDYALTDDGRLFSVDTTMRLELVRSNVTGISARSMPNPDVLILDDVGAGYLLSCSRSFPPQARRAFDSCAKIAAISAGPWQHLGLKPGGDLWSRGGYAPEGSPRFVAVDTHTNYSLGLKGDGTLAAWGSSPVVSQYSPLSNVVSFSAGPTHALAIVAPDGAPVIHGPVGYRAIGFVQEPLPLWARASGASPMTYSWYLNGQVVVGADSPTPQVSALGIGTNFVQAVVSNAFGCVTSALHTIHVRAQGIYGSDVHSQGIIPPQLQARSIASGAFHHAAIATKGSVVSWGKNRYGQANLIFNMPDACQIAAGGEHTLVLRRNGSILGAGCNWRGQLGITNYKGSFVAVSAGAAHSLALKNDGTLVAAGERSSGQADIGLLSKNITSIASGYWHNIALQSDGSILTAGLDFPIPCSVSNVVAVAAGWESCLALRADGTVTAWGDNSYGQCNVPLEATNLVAIAGGSFHYVGTRADGSIVAWGRNYRGTTQIPYFVRAWNGVSCGEDVTIVDASAAVPEIGPNVGLLSAVEGSPLVIPARFTGSGPLSFQWFHSGNPILHATNRFLFIPSVTIADVGTYSLQVQNALGEDSGLITTLEVKQCGGQPHSIQAWQNAVDTRAVAASAAASPACAVSAGGYHILTLDVQGRVHSCGKNADGQAKIPQTATNIVQIAAGGDHSLALTEKGTVLAWGRNWDGQCDVPMSATNVIAIAAGWAHSLALRADGAVLAWGNGEYGQNYVSPVAVDVLAIAAGYYHSMALRSDGRVAVWGLDAPVPEAAVNVIAIAAGREHCLALRADGTVVAWGDNRFGQCDVPSAATNVVAVSAGFFRSTALCADGTLVTWGFEQSSGRGNPTNLGAGSLSAGEYFDSALLPSAGAPLFGRTLKTIITSPNAGKIRLFQNVAGSNPMEFQWYLNGTAIAGATNRWLDAEMGTGNWSGSYSMMASNEFGANASPIVNVAPASSGTSLTVVGGWGSDGSGQLRVPAGLESTVAIASGGFHCLALSSDGTILAWGKNRDGQTSVPYFPRTSGIKFIKVAAGSDHSLALTDRGLVIGWGRDWDGQATPPSEIDGWPSHWEPPGAPLVTSISAGYAHSLALTVDGRVHAWGNNDLGQTNVPYFPAKVMQISAGYYHNLALVSDGAVAVWGLMDRLPTQPIVNPVAVSAGWWHSLVLQANGQVIAWGDNTYGQCSVPPNATNVVAISAGFYASYALRPDGTVIAWGSTRNGVLNVPADLKNVSALSAGEDFVMVIAEKGAPWLASPLPNASLHVGESFTILPEARGTSPLTYRWYHDGIPLETVTHSSLNLTNVQTSSAGNYQLVIVNGSGQSQAFNTTVSVSRAPNIVPLDAPPVPLGGTIRIAPVLHGETSGMQYAWSANGTLLQDDGRVRGTQSPVLSIYNAGYQDSGVYTLKAFNQFGSQTRVVAEIDVSSVVGFGYDYAGQISVPESAKEAVAVAAAGDQSLALRPDGTLVAWGDPAYGKNDLPVNATNIVAIVNDRANSLALTADGKPICWGNPGFGLTSVPASATNVLAIALGQTVAYAWRVDGSLVSWGSTPFVLSDSNVVDLAISLRGTIGLLPSGRLAYTWLASPPAEATNIVRISAGLEHFLALRADGKVLAWGSGYYGQCSVPDGLVDVVDVEAGDYFSLALLNDGRVVGWGGVNWSETFFDPVPVPEWVTGLRKLSAGSAHCLGVATAAQRSTQVTCTVTGDGPMFLSGPRSSLNTRYQWYHNGLAMDGATNNWLRIAQTLWHHRGYYVLAATNSFGEVSYHTVNLQVQHLPPKLAVLPPTEPSTNGAPPIHVTGLIGSGPVIMEASADLRVWTPVLTNPPTAGSLIMQESNSEPLNKRFYRVTEIEQD